MFPEVHKLVNVFVEGSAEEIQFEVTYNPPLPADIKHELICLNGGTEVPATRRFTARQNIIILNNVKLEDSGIYQISCNSRNGQIGKEIFELKVYCK